MIMKLFAVFRPSQEKKIIITWIIDRRVNSSLSSKIYGFMGISQFHLNIFFNDFFI